MARGLGDYIHRYYNNYLKYGVNNFRKPEYKGDELFTDLDNASQDIRNRVRQYSNMANAKAKTANTLEEYLNGIFYSKTILDNINNRENDDSVVDSRVKEIFETIGKALNQHNSIFEEGFYNNAMGMIRRNFEPIDEKQEQLTKTVGTFKSIVRSLEGLVQTLKRRGVNDATLNEMENIKNQIDNLIASSGKTKNKQFIKIENNQDLIGKISQAINFINSQQDLLLVDSRLAGDIGEQVIAAALLCGDNTQENILRYLKESVVGAEGTETVYQFSKNLNATLLLEGGTFEKAGGGKDFHSRGLNTTKTGELYKNERFRHWRIENNELRSSKSQDTVDVSVNLAEYNTDLQKALGIDRLNASIKNYANSNQIKLLSGAPLLSILRIGNIKFANHYLNFISRERLGMENAKINFSYFNEVLKNLIAIRGFLGIRDLKQGGSSSTRLNEYLIINDKSKRHVFVYYAPDLVKKISEGAMDLMDIKGLPDKVLPSWKGVNSEGRIEHILAEINARKITAHFNHKAVMKNLTN